MMLADVLEVWWWWCWWWWSAHSIQVLFFLIPFHSPSIIVSSFDFACIIFGFFLFFFLFFFVGPLLIELSSQLGHSRFFFPNLRLCSFALDSLTVVAAFDNVISMYSFPFSHFLPFHLSSISFQLCRFSLVFLSFFISCFPFFLFLFFWLFLFFFFVFVGTKSTTTGQIATTTTWNRTRKTTRRRTKANIWRGSQARAARTRSTKGQRSGYCTFT